MASREEDIEAFRRCRTFDDLNALMIKVVKNEMRSPVYDFDEIGGDSASDNHWWNGPRWKLLVEINENGVITFNAEEGIDDPFVSKDVINFRCSLYCLIKRELADTFIKRMQADGYLVVRSDAAVPNFKKLSLESQSPSRKFQTSSEVIKSELVDDPGTAAKVYGIPPRVKSFADSVFLPYLNDEFASTLLTQHATEVVIIDPWYNRTAHSRLGLFSVVLFNAENTRLNAMVSWSGPPIIKRKTQL